MREFVAEQYIPGATAAAADACAARQAAEEMTRQGTRVQVVSSIFIPDDETCIHLYRADSIEAVRAAASRAALPLERISEAVTWVAAGARARACAATGKTPTQRK
jgi:Nickel responsive protein SCO4226-like